MFSSSHCFHAFALPTTHRQQQSGDQVEEELQESTMAGKWVGGREAWGWAGFCSRGRERAARFFVEAEAMRV